MNGGQLDAGLVRFNLVGDAFVEFGDEGGERLRLAVIRPAHDRVHVRPALGTRLAGGSLGSPTDAREDVAHNLAHAPVVGGGCRRGPQTRNRGTHVVTSEEGLSPGDGHGNTARSQGLFEGLGLTVRTHEDSDRMGRHATRDKVRDRRRDALGLGSIVVVGAVGDLGAAVALTGQPHRSLTLTRARQDVVRQTHDLRGRPVVAGQLDDASPGVLAPETGQVVRGGTREGVNGLRDVADDAHVVSPTQPQVEQTRLEEVDVLKLIDHE